MDIPTSYLLPDGDFVNRDRFQCSNEEGYLMHLKQEIKDSSLEENLEKNSIPVCSEENKRNHDTWHRTLSKRARQAGQEYVNKKGDLIKARKLKEGCSERCRMKCKSKLTEEQRYELFNEFWNIDSHKEKWNYLAMKVLSQPVKSQTTQWESRRKESRTYNFRVDGKNIMVCKPMFLNTLGINDAWVRTALQKQGRSSILKDDLQRRKNKKRRLDPELVSSVRHHISAFPKVFSHHYESDTSREYLDANLDIRKMYRLYKNWVSENYQTQIITANERQYRHIFNNDFNLQFLKPNKEM